MWQITTLFSELEQKQNAFEFINNKNIFNFSIQSLIQHRTMLNAITPQGEVIFFFRDFYSLTTFTVKREVLTRNICFQNITVCKQDAGYTRGTNSTMRIRGCRDQKGGRDALLLRYLYWQKQFITNFVTLTIVCFHFCVHLFLYVTVYNMKRNIKMANFFFQ